MRKLVLADRVLTQRDCFIIAEIGSNHQGDPDLCEQMIIAAARCGVDAVKMQKRDNRKMFTPAALDRPYDNGFSYGKSYGEHRVHLDWFGWAEFKRFKAVAEKHGVLFFATPFEEASADFLHFLGCNLWKIASCDVTNLPLVEKVARFGDPVIISTGGASMADIDRLVRMIGPITSNYALLHCVSTYPNTDENVNVSAITTLRENYPLQLVGFSTHHPGMVPLIIARTIGAAIFEIHFTMNRGSRGTDHGFSFEPKGLAQAVEDIKRVRTMLGTGRKEPLESERAGFIRKMGKSIYAARPIPAGKVLEAEDMEARSPADGLPPYRMGDLQGLVVKYAKKAGQVFSEST
jgi:N-acetylneuraminate synthase/sialic acid synthase